MPSGRWRIWTGTFRWNRWRPDRNMTAARYPFLAVNGRIVVSGVEPTVRELELLLADHVDEDRKIILRFLRPLAAGMRRMPRVRKWKNAR